MGRKIFVSYKYADSDVENLTAYGNSTVRDYVNEFERMIDSTDHIYKGEHDEEDLSGLSDATIWAKLRNRIYDSSLTIVFISPGMKVGYMAERDQWIPWEISYSLKETSRTDSSGRSVTSRTNAMLAVVLPDCTGSYSYYLERKYCCSSQCVTHHIGKLFQIIRDNKFNLKEGNKRTCSNGDTVWTGSCSYIEAVRWSDFKLMPTYYIEQAENRRDNLEDYKIVKEIKQ